MKSSIAYIVRKAIRNMYGDQGNKKILVLR